MVRECKTLAGMGYPVSVEYTLCFLKSVILLCALSPNTLSPERIDRQLTSTGVLCMAGKVTKGFKVITITRRQMCLHEQTIAETHGI